MKMTAISGLALALVISLSSVTQAQENKMTREEYVAQMADLQQREAAAQQQIETLNGQIEIWATVGLLDWPLRPK